jgi:hypothetical protein
VDYESQFKTKCTVCSTPFDEDDWGVMGYIGSLTLSCCANCTNGIFEMVYQLSSKEDLQEQLAKKDEQEQINEEEE